MTPNEFYDEMSEIKRIYGGDQEMVHVYMDECMCELLRNLGYGKGIEVFENTAKWYA